MVHPLALHSPCLSPTAYTPSPCSPHTQTNMTGIAEKLSSVGYATHQVRIRAWLGVAVAVARWWLGSMFQFYRCWLGSMFQVFRWWLGSMFQGWSWYDLLLCCVISLRELAFSHQLHPLCVPSTHPHFPLTKPVRWRVAGGQVERGHGHHTPHARGPRLQQQPGLL